MSLSRESPLSELVELVPAIACSLITTTYITQTESTTGDLSTDINSPSQSIFHIVWVDFLRDIPPGVALGSCLVLGCCLSSYVHRRRDQDQYQVIVFIIWVSWAICIGWGIGVSANRVMLGIMPWATCAAMLSSFFGHAAARWVSVRERCERETIFALVSEKETLFGT
ncbi:hypothetical protein M426DRAFT_322762 [Hypoxylon sp. CI-4A]|nr:hypothetical protein M426DRAFT_322762 [Hypoxylon sp. CI-4A]